MSKAIKQCKKGAGAFKEVILIHAGDIKRYEPLTSKRKYGDRKREVYVYNYKDFTNKK